MKGQSLSFLESLNKLRKKAYFCPRRRKHGGYFWTKVCLLLCLHFFDIWRRLAEKWVVEISF